MTEDTSQGAKSEVGGYSMVSHNFKVSVAPAPMANESSPTENSYAFSYTVTIENLSDKTAQLLERHWVVLSAERQFAEVVGPGVIGEQPVLKPGESFTYSSGAVIEDPYGSMHGSYTFRAEDGEFFEVEIPRFELLFPVVIH